MYNNNSINSINNSNSRIVNSLIYNLVFVLVSFLHAAR